MSNHPATSYLLRCPACRGELDQGRCVECDETFSSTLGILDLRWPRPDAQENSSPRSIREQRIIETIVGDFDSASFDVLVGKVFDVVGVPKGASAELVGNFQTYRTDPEERGNRMMSMFRQRLDQYYSLSDTEIALDIGCGVGTSTYALSRQFGWVIGFDPTLSNLLLAKKYCEENEISNVTFFQAYAQSIPLDDSCISYAVAQNVIEHLHDVLPAFREIQRVLRPGGCFCGDSRNRYDLFFPEPHVNIRLLGYVPRALQPWVVQKLRKLPYTSAHLLSLRELRDASRRAFGETAVVTLPLASTYGQDQRWDGTLAAVEQLPLLGHILLAIFPTHVLVACAQKPVATPHQDGKNETELAEKEGEEL